MDKKNMTEYIKVNLPLTEQDYLAGNGEGVWVLVDPKTKQAHDTDAIGGGYVGILDNDSCYYPGLNAGQLIPFELRGSYRPVANFYSFLSKLPRLTPEGKALLLERIAMYQAGHNRPTDPSDPHYEGMLCCDCQCESRVEQELGKSGGNAAKDMTKQARQGADQGGGLDVS